VAYGQFLGNLNNQVRLTNLFFASVQLYCIGMNTLLLMKNELTNQQSSSGVPTSKTKVLSGGIQIGPYMLRNNVFLAPMAGITDAPFRQACAREQVGYAASEMISSDATLHATEKTKHRVLRCNNGLPHAVQIAGSSATYLADAAEFNVRLGADIIDINMGCPAKKVCNKAAGSALLEHPKLVREILRSVVSRVSVPVTLKIRTGPHPAARNGLEIAKIAEKEGVLCIAVHGRTRSDKFNGEAEYDTIKMIKDNVSIPVIANGDIRSANDALQVLKHTNADGVMIGRAAQGNPWIFNEVVSVLAAKPLPSRPSFDEIRDTLLTQLEGIYELYGEQRGVRIARKHIAWYCIRQRINYVDSAKEQTLMIQQFFDRPDRFNSAA